MSIKWIHDATHVDLSTNCFYKKVDGVWHLVYSDGASAKSVFLYNGETKESELVERQPKQWSGPQDGLPPVGLEIEIKIDFKKAPPYTIITLTELGVDVQKHVPRFQKATVLYASSKYLVTDACGVECLTPMSCVEFRAILSAEQKLQEKRETAIREFMDIVGTDCRVTASKAVDAGFKREACKSDCSTNNRGVPELLGPCDCR